MSTTTLTSLPDPVVQQVQDGLITMSIQNFTVGFKLDTAEIIFWGHGGEDYPQILLSPVARLQSPISLDWTDVPLKFITTERDYHTTKTQLILEKTLPAGAITVTLTLNPGHRSFDQSVEIIPTTAVQDTKYRYDYILPPTVTTTAISTHATEFIQDGTVLFTFTRTDNEEVKT